VCRPGYVLAAMVLGISQICGVASLPGWEGAPVETEHGAPAQLKSTGPDRSDRPMLQGAGMSNPLDAQQTLDAGSLHLDAQQTLDARRWITA